MTSTEMTEIKFDSKLSILRRRRRKNVSFYSTVLAINSVVVVVVVGIGTFPVAPLRAFAHFYDPATMVASIQRTATVTALST